MVNKKIGRDISPYFIFFKKGFDNIKVMAIDQARNGGWSIFDYEKKELIKYGYFSFPSEKYTYAKAILNIEKTVQDLLLSNNISAVFIEDIQLRARNIQSFKRLAQLQGVLINLFEKNEYLYDYISPSKWQSYCNARGRTSKELKSNKIKSDIKESKRLSIEYVYDKYGVETLNDNLSDAICIGDYVVNNVCISKHKGDLNE